MKPLPDFRAVKCVSLKRSCGQWAGLCDSNCGEERIEVPRGVKINTTLMVVDNSPWIFPV